MTVIALEPVSTALLALLRTSDFPVGDHEAPTPSAGAPQATAGRYSVLQAIPGGAVDGSQGNTHEQAVLVYQVDSTGRSRQQCDWLADKNRALLLDPASYPVVAGACRIDGAWQQTVDRPEPEGKDETGQPTWTRRERFEVLVVPS